VILLLDAHVVLWALADPTALADQARGAIADPSNEVIVSAATVWEIEIKRALGKLRAPDDVVGALEATGMGVLPVTGPDAVRAARLPPHHRDTFDRIVIAQAQRLDAVIVTRDAAFVGYDAAVMPA
jgi:PIN domain nuclease of toxin-antitoxin system